MTGPRYRDVLRRPGVPLVLAAGILGRLTFGILPFAAVIAFAATGGFGAAGAAAAAFLATNALLAPVRGRLVDRRGAGVLAWMAVLHLLAVVGAAALLPVSPWLLALPLLAIAGATIPPIGPALRSSWSRLAPGQDELQRLHALDSVVEELTFVVAPLVTIGLVAVGSARWTLPIGAALLLPAVAIIVRFGGLDHAPPAAPSGTDAVAADREGRRRALMLRPSGQGIVIPIITLGAVGGGLAVLLPAIADQTGAITTAGYAFAVYSLGGAIAGLVYGRLHWRAPLHRRYVVITACFTLGVALLIPATSTVLTLLAVFVAGAALTPMFVVAYLLVDERIEAHRLTEANSWLSSGYNIGSAGGAALCGILVSQVPPAAVAAVYTLIAGLGLLGSLRLPAGPVGVPGLSTSDVPGPREEPVSGVAGTAAP